MADEEETPQEAAVENEEVEMSVLDALKEVRWLKSRKHAICSKPVTHSTPLWLGSQKGHDS